MRVAVVGHGVIGRLHAEILNERGMLCAVCDPDPEARNAAPDVIRCGDYEEMLDTVKPDAVHICTPHYLHAQMVVAALKRNIHVLCEKPLCIRPEEIDEILAAERNSNAVLGVCLQNRYNKANRFVKDRLKNAKNVSGVGQVAWHRSAEYYASGDWRGKWETEGGGVLINQALHTLDLMQWFLGMPSSLSAMTANLSLACKIEVEDSATILCRGEHPFSFFATVGSATDFPVLIQLKADGEKITLLPDRVLIGTEETAFAAAPQRLVCKPCYGNGHAALIDDFYECIESGNPFPINGEEGAKVVRLILAAYESRGASVALDRKETV